MWTPILPVWYAINRQVAINGRHVVTAGALDHLRGDTARMQNPLKFTLGKGAISDLSSGSLEREPGRWRRRLILAKLIGALAFLLPVLAAMSVALLVARVLPKPESAAALIIWWATFLASSIVTLIAFDLLAKRLLPLPSLLRMTLLFPDRAPSRLLVARRAGKVRDLRKRVQEAHQLGLSDEPTLAASRILELAASLSAHDRLTRGHSERVRVFIDLLAEELPIAPGDRERLRWAGLLHDIGKLAVSPEILNKRGRPDPDEWEAIKRHPLEGIRIAKPLQSFLGEWAGTIEHHHEKFDGSGYPHGIVGEQISFGGRIASVADSFEVMTAARPYKHPMAPEAARAELTRCAGTHFDPSLVRAFLNISVGRLWRAIGFLSWLAQFPVFRQLSYGGFFDRIGRTVGVWVVAVLGVIALFATGVAGAPTVGATPAPAQRGARDPQDARAEVRGNVAIVSWSAETSAEGYSISWSGRTQEQPDTIVDLPGSAAEAASPPLDPGVWWFNLRTKGRDGQWTGTIHINFRIDENPGLARVEGRFDAALTGVSSEGTIRAVDHHLRWSFAATCPAGPCDLRRNEGALLSPSDSFTYDGSSYRGRLDVPIDPPCRVEKASIDFRVTRAAFVGGVWRATELTGTKTVEVAANGGCRGGRGAWNFVALPL